MTTSEQLELALWALNGNRAWLGLSVARRAEYVVMHRPHASAAPELLPDTFSEDPWESLKLARSQLQLSATAHPLETAGMPWLVQITWERHRKLGITLDDAIECIAREQALSHKTLRQLQECFAPEGTPV
jgi:hypothetical protein